MKSPKKCASTFLCSNPKPKKWIPARLYVSHGLLIRKTVHNFHNLVLVKWQLKFLLKVLKTWLLHSHGRLHLQAAIWNVMLWRLKDCLLWTQSCLTKKVCSWRHQHLFKHLFNICSWRPQHLLVKLVSDYVQAANKNALPERTADDVSGTDAVSNCCYHGRRTFTIGRLRFLLVCGRRIYI